MGTIDLETRIDRLESRFEIAELVGAYCSTCDSRDMLGMAAIFTEDIVMESSDGGMNSCGKDEVIAMFNRVLGIRGPGFHWTHDHTVKFDNDDPNLATGTVEAHAETSPNFVVSISALRYHDTYRREGGIWRFAKRSLTFFYYVPIAEFINRFKELERVLAPVGWRAADYPDKLDSWKEWQANNA